MKLKEKVIVVVMTFGIASIPIWQDLNEQNKLEQSVTSYGFLKRKLNRPRRGISLEIKYKVKNQSYISYNVSSYDAFEILPIGTKFMIKYAESDPNISRIVFLQHGQFNFHDSGVSVPGKVYRVIEYRKFNFFLAPVRNKEVYYAYYYNGIKYLNVRFVSKALQIREGQEYLVEFPKGQPEKGTINLDKPFDIFEIIKNANMHPDTTKPQTTIRDTIINSDSTKVIQFEY
jgi:hypothetical protein